ncbi:MAG: ParB N-terminal domain-containing protein [Desulfobulbaceae bacterium]|nr:ParB N-terminal domain-containing protein [Desulfobulbaceae bacterium]
MHISRININQINFSDDTYDLIPACCTSQPSASLVASIKRFGILHPPIVKELSPTSFQVISGRKRLLTLREIDSAVSCECLKLNDKTTEIETLAFGLQETLLCRSLSAIEQATFFHKALQWVDDKELTSGYLPLLGLTPTNFHIKKGLKLLELEEPLIIAVHHGTLDEKVAYELGRLSFSDRMALFEVIEALKLSVGNQKKLTVISRELAARQNATISQLLRNENVHEIIDHADANVPQKTNNLMSWLHCQRFPRLTDAENKFNNFVSALKLPAEIRLDHSPSFEKDELRLTLTFPDQQHFLSAWEEMKNILPANKERKNT